MDTSTLTRDRTDLFTHIHKGLRRGLFELSMVAGSTDWTSHAEVERLAEHWVPMLELLHAHTRHEDDHIFRLLDGRPEATSLPEDDHRDLDDLLADLEERFVALQARPDGGEGLRWYRDLNRYIGTTLHHLHEEETIVMPALWRTHSDEELLACRARFLAETSPSVMSTSLRLMLSSLDTATKHAHGLG